jgi:hypothetical protein
VKLEAALREAHEAEAELAGRLLAVGERHRDEHDVFHLTRTLHTWSQDHVGRLAEQGRRHGLELDADAAGGEHGAGLVTRLREKGSELVGRRPEPALLLLDDLRDLHLAAARASLAWTVLGQGAQALDDRELLAAVTACHPQTIRILEWTVQKVKDAAPQALAS